MLSHFSLNVIFQLARRRVGLVGAFVYSAANFLITFTLQVSISPQSFGLYAVTLVFLQFGQSMSNALFASPMVVSLSSVDTQHSPIIASYFGANLIYCLITAAVLCGLVIYFGGSPIYALVVVVLTTLTLMRWFFRAVELSEQNFTAPALADITYAVVSPLAAVFLFLFVGRSAEAGLIAMTVGAAASFWSMSKQRFDFRMLFQRSALKYYRDAFRKYAKWATLGVVTTELTANVHAYAISFFLGPHVFAPVAAAALFFRPIPILMQAVTQYERPMLARMLAERRVEEMKTFAVRINHFVALAAICNTILVGVMLFGMPHAIGGGSYGPASLAPIVALLAAGQVVRSLRTGTSAALQAAGYYRALAFVTVIAAPVSLFGVAGALAVGVSDPPPLLASVLIGEIVTAVLITYKFRQLLGAAHLPE